MAANSQEIRTTFNDVTIDSLVITKPTGEVLQLIPEPEDVVSKYTPFQTLHIEESIFLPSTRGSITIREMNEGVESYNFTGEEKVVLKIYTPDDNGSPVENSYKTLTFFINNVENKKEAVSESIDDGINVLSFWILHFCSYEYLILSRKADAFMENDFIGPIASDEENDDKENNNKGLINEIKNKYFSKVDFEIEPTENSIWLKRNHLMYPWTKDRNPPNLINLLENVSEYAVSSSNPYATNYLFWQDLDGYHFKSIEKIIKDHDELSEEENENRKYIIDAASVVSGKKNTIESFVPTKEGDVLNLERGGVFSSYYQMVKPDYTNPYFDQVSFESSHIKYPIIYNYHDHKDHWRSIEKYKIIPDSIETNINRTNRIYDKIYGYFDSPYNEPNELEYDWMSSDENKINSKLWQTMFDQTDLDSTILKKIQKDIREQLKENKRKYVDIKDLESEWNTYECSICCLSGVRGETGDTEYNIVSAGSFSDVVDYGLTEDEELLSPEEMLELSLFRNSYEDEDYYDNTIKEFYHLRDLGRYQENFVDLEIAKFKIIKEFMSKTYDKCTSNPCGSGPFETNCHGSRCPDKSGTFENDYEDKSCDHCYHCCETCFNADYITCPGEPEITSRSRHDNTQCELYLNKLQEKLQAVDDQIILWDQWRDKIEEKYDTYRDRKAYFISKDLELEKLNDLNKKDTSLFNVKRITRKNIRGSRYEIFARKYNIKEDKLGEWIYDTYLGNDTERDPTEEGNHPFYDLKYVQPENFGPSAYLSSSQWWYGYHECSHEGRCGNREYARSESPYDYEWWYDDWLFNNYRAPLGGVSPDHTELDQVLYVCPGPDNTTETFHSEQSPPWGTVGPYWSDQAGSLLLPSGWNPFEYSERFNLYEENLNEYKPTEIQKKEIQSYVRIEFKEPIGLDSLEDFPEGFVRDAGYEYFLPYLVMLTPGPYGKQSVRKNIAVIGIDPYGFDVAVDEEDLTHITAGSPYRGDVSGASDVELNNITLHESDMLLYPEIINEHSYYSSGGFGAGSKSNKWWSNPLTESLNDRFMLLSSNSHLMSISQSSWYEFNMRSPLGSGTYWGSYYSYNYWYWWHIRHDPMMNDYSGANFPVEDYFFYSIPLDVGETYNFDDVIDSLYPANDNINSFIGISDHWEWWYTSGWGYWLTFGSLLGFNHLKGFYNLYERDTILDEKDLWKYDISGNLEYGLSVPPKTRRTQSDYDSYGSGSFEERLPDFGRNFSAQFVVYAKEKIDCGEGYSCANPDGQVSTEGCSSDEPWCNCPCQELIPRKESLITIYKYNQIGGDPGDLDENTEFIIIDENADVIEEFTSQEWEDAKEWLIDNGTIIPKPDTEEINKALEDTKECNLIEDVLGEDWMGCMWGEQNHPSSCNCPCVGRNFSKYIEYTRTYSTYWDTPEYVPLTRNAQMKLIASHQALTLLNGDLSLRPGTIIDIEDLKTNDHHTTTDNNSTRHSGNWLISSIIHTIKKQNHSMSLSLIRDSTPYDPNKSQDRPWLFKSLE